MLTEFLRGLFPIECLICRGEGSWLCINHKNLSPAPANRVTYRYLDQIWATAAYRDPAVQNLIEHFKFRHFKQLAPILARHIYENSPQSGWNQAVLVPIPLHWRRRLWRGYNQSELIARELCLLHPKLEVDSKILKRVKPTTQQARLDKLSRTKNLESAFVTTGQLPKNKKIILIDDVVASGSTLDSATQTLKQVGAIRVEAIVFARSGNI